MKSHRPIPYGRQTIEQDDIDAVVEVLNGDWLTTGPAVAAFERALERAVGAPTAAVSSGTAALHAAYAAIGVGPGAEVVTTPLTFAATATAALHLGASVSFADVRDDTLMLDPDAASAACNMVTRAIVTVDFAGQPSHLAELRTVSDREGAVLVEDAAHAIGATYRGQPVGAIADITTFSFHPVKTVTTGEGGAISTHVPAWLEAVRQFRNHGLVRDRARLRYPEEGSWHQEVQTLGLNYRLPDILAALGTSQLNRLRTFVERRAALVRRYRDLLSDVPEIRLPEDRLDARPAWHLFPVRILDGRRKHVMDHLRSRRIGAQVHYMPVHRQPLFEDLGYRRGSCPVAEQAYEELLSLPLYPSLTDDDQDHVVMVLRDALG